MCSFFRCVQGEAYKFAVDQIGLDYYSTDIWREYIDFTKETPTTTFHEENQKILDVRKVSAALL